MQILSTTGVLWGCLHVIEDTAFPQTVKSIANVRTIEVKYQHFFRLNRLCRCLFTKKYMYLLFVRTRVTRIIITVIKIKPKIRHNIFQALGITFPPFSHLTNTRTKKKTKRNKASCTVLVDAFDRPLSRAFKGWDWEVRERSKQQKINNYGNFHHKKSVEHLRENV